MKISEFKDYIDWPIPARMVINNYPYTLLDIPQVHISLNNDIFSIVSFDNIDDVGHIAWDEYDEVSRLVKEHSDGLCLQEKGHTFSISSYTNIRFSHPLLYPSPEYIIKLNEEFCIHIGKKGLRPMALSLHTQDIYIKTARLKNLVEELKNKISYLNAENAQDCMNINDIIMAYCEAVGNGSMELWNEHIKGFAKVKDIMDFKQFRESCNMKVSEAELIL